LRIRNLRLPLSLSSPQTILSCRNLGKLHPGPVRYTRMSTRHSIPADYDVFLLGPFLRANLSRSAGSHITLCSQRISEKVNLGCRSLAGKFRIIPNFQDKLRVRIKTRANTLRLFADRCCYGLGRLRGNNRTQRGRPGDEAEIAFLLTKLFPSNEDWVTDKRIFRGKRRG